MTIGSLGYVGFKADDLDAWARFGTETLGMMPVDALYAAYEKASGLPVDPARIVYFNVYNRYLLVVLTLSASARASRIRGTHQDVLVNFIVSVGYPALADLREYFLEVLR